MTRWFIPSVTAGECRPGLQGLKPRPSAVAVCRRILGPSQDEAARNHVVQCLLLFCKSRHGVTDPQGNQAGDYFCEIPAAGVGES